MLLKGNNTIVEATSENRQNIDIASVCSSKPAIPFPVELSIEQITMHEAVHDSLNPYENTAYSNSIYGMQRKDLNDAGDIVKADSAGREGLNEYLCYLISLYVEEINIVEYVTCLVDDGCKISSGCISKHLSNYGIKEFIALDKLIRNKNIKFSSLSREMQMSCLSKLVDINKLMQLIAFDVLVCNTDRHLGNICMTSDGLCKFQYDNGRAFGIGTATNIYVDSIEVISKSCVYKPFDFTTTSFIETFKALYVPKLTIDRNKCIDRLYKVRDILYSQIDIMKRVELFEYQLDLLKDIIWEERI